MIAPTIHLNGSNGERLRDQYLAIARALSEACSKVRILEIHGRDYYVNADSDAADKAFARKQEILTDLDKYFWEIMDVTKNIQDQLNQRSKR